MRGCAAFAASVAVLLLVGGAAASQSRQLLQGDPFTQFNEPAAPATVASGAPSFNMNGVAAASNSATTVPVMGTLAAPLPGAGYAAGYAPQAYGGVSVANPNDPYAAYAQAYPGYAAQQQQQYAQAYPGYGAAPAAAPYGAAAATPGYDPIAAAAGIISVPPAAAPAPASPPPPPPPPAKPKIAIQAGMMLRSEMQEQIPANASALPAIRVPEGTTTKLAYVCDITGALFIAVDREALIRCQSDHLINLAKLSGIKGAKSVTCPDNRHACPGNNAVSVIVKLDNTLDKFESVVAQWRVNMATAISMPLDRVVVVDVEVLGGAKKPAAAAPAKPAADGARIAPLRKLLGDVEDTDAVVQTAKPRRSKAYTIEDTAAVVEEEYRPKAKIVVTTNIQPLTDDEAMSVLGTTKSGYFKDTFYDGAAKMGLAVIDGFRAENSEPGDEFEFPEKVDPKAAATAAKPKAAKPAAAAKKSADAADLDATSLKAVPLTPEELAAKAKREAADRAAAANATAIGIKAANVTGAPMLPARAAAASGAEAATATKWAAAALCVAAAALLL